MATQLQIRRGTTSQMNAFTGAEGELAVNTTTDTVHVHDGSTAGGHALAKADGSNIATYAGSFTTIAASGTITGNVTGNLTGSVLTAAQTNITSVGTLSALTVSGALTVDTDTLVVDATNNRVGINRASPSGLLHMQSSSGTDSALYMQTSATSDDSVIYFGDDGSSTVGKINYSHSDNSMRFNTLGSEAMRISGGNVGIGQATPKTTLNAAANNSGQGAILTLENTDTSITTNDVIGQIDFYANDSSTNGTGAKVNIKAIATSTAGTATALTFGTSSSGSATAVEAMRIDASGSIISSMAGGVFFKNSSGGTSSTQILVSNNGGSMRAGVESSSGGEIQVGTSAYAAVFGNQGNYPTQFTTNGTLRATIDTSGNFIVGSTNPAPVSNNVVGVSIRNFGEVQMSTNNQGPLYLNRKGSDGTLVTLRKENGDVGSISSRVGVHIQIQSAGNTAGLHFGGSEINPVKNQVISDNTIDLGQGSYRFDDIYATNGTIQTSDRNEKQDIEALSDAEQRVAVAAKGLMRKFRWIDAVEAKGDDARIHFGIIAQDLQAAFEAEGLDAGRYAMFTSNTWWETQTEVAAVEAVEATEDTEAVEAVDAYTRTDTYDTAEEAPEGATERTRLGVRYSELLAFIIAAI